MRNGIRALIIKMECAELIREEEKDKYQYIYTLLFEKAITTTILFFLAILFHNMIETLVFSICFIELRKRTGGFHCKSFIGCLVFTVCIYFLILVLGRMVNVSAYPTMHLASCVSAGWIYLIGAVNVPKMHYTKEEYQYQKKTARIIVTIEWIAVIAMILVKIDVNIVFFAEFGMVMASISTFGEWYKIHARSSSDANNA